MGLNPVAGLYPCLKRVFTAQPRRIDFAENVLQFNFGLKMTGAFESSY